MSTSTSRAQPRIVDIPRSTPLKLRALALGAVWAAASVALPAQAYVAITTVNANDSARNHDTIQGVTTQSYNGPIASGGGSVGIGGTVSTSFVSDTDFINGIPYSGYAYGSANLNSGSLHAVANSTYGVPVAGGFAQVGARWVDDITFTTAGASAGTMRTVVVDLQFSGGLSQELNFNMLYGFRMSGLGGGGGQISRRTILDSEPGPSPNDFLGPVEVYGFDDGWQVLSNDVGNMHFRALVTYTGASKSFNLDTGLSLRCTSGTSCDFGNSAHLRFELPPDVTFTSGSGALLTSAVPEPGGQLLLLAGLLAVALTTRWRVATRMRA